MLVAIVVISLESRTAVQDPDNWWHLRVGQWIMQNHSFPHVGLFSRGAAGRPWMAYSWGYELLLARSYDSFGLVGIAGFGLALTLLVAAVFYWTLLRVSNSFWTAWILCAAGSYAFLFMLLPRPVFFSMTMLAIVLMLLLEAHRESDLRRLYWLPLVFIFWANLHIQFIYGLFAVALFAAITCAQRVAAHYGFESDKVAGNSLPATRVLAVLAACILGCCVGPYGYHLFGVIFNYGRSQLPFTFIQELQSPEFRTPTDYVLLLMMAAAYFALGWERKIDVFKTLLLITASVFAFRARRDVWFVGVCSAMMIADFFGRRAEKAEAVTPAPRLKLWEFAASAALVAVLTVVMAPQMGLSNRSLDRIISKNFPVDAVNYVRKNPAPGPLYNDFNWGGFLIWYMPDRPVSIDGRTDLYGDAATEQAMKSLGGSFEADKNLDEAGVVILNKSMPMPWKLAADPRFRIVYQDQLAAVFVRNE